MLQQWANHNRIALFKEKTIIMGLSYGRDKFQAATRTLVSSLPLHQRISNAFSDFLFCLKEEDLPAEAVPEFNNLMKRVTGLEAKPDEEPSSQISTLSNYQLEAIAERIVVLHTILCEAYERKKRSPIFIKDHLLLLKQSD